MKRFAFVVGAGCLLAAPALAQMEGDVAEGEKAFRQCQTCHVVVNDAGETLAGRNAKTGPNLYGVIGRPAASEEDFNYGDSLKAAGEKGLVWDEEHFVEYVQDPTAFLREYLDDQGARSKMTFRVRSEDDAKNLAAYLSSLAPDSSG